MSQYGPGDAPPVVRKRARKNRKPAAARPLAAAPPRKMARASEPKVKLAARPLAAEPPRALAKASEPGVQTSSRSQRGKAVAAYNKLTGKQKQKVLADARRNPGTATNRAILHIHDTRKARNVALAKGAAGHDSAAMSDADKIDEFKKTRAYQDALRAGRAGHQQKGNGGEAAHQVLTTAGPNSFDKVLAPLRKRAQSTALSALEQISRPIHGIAAAAKEDVKSIKAGESPIGNSSYKQFGRGLALKDRSTFSDVLKEAGVKNKIVLAAGGFALDVALDPTTYLTLGVGVPAKVAAKSAQAAALKAGRQAVKAGEITQTQLERKALETARKVYDAHPEHAKHHGVRVGARGIPVKALTGKREVGKKAVHGARLTAAVRGAVRAGSTEGSRKLGGELADKAGKQFIHDYRPRDVHPVDHDYARASARRFRSAREAADRHAETRARAIHKAVKEARPRATEAARATDESTVIHAIEAGIVRNLPDPLRDIAMAIQHDLEQAGQAELSKGLRTTLDIKGAAPDVVEAVNVKAVRDELRAAVKEAAALEMTHLKSLQGYGVARGRASILSRNVGGTKAERDAELRDVFQGGAHGEQQAREALEEGLAAVHASRLKVNDLKEKLAATVEQDAAHKAGLVAAAEHAAKPEDYFPRHMKDEVFDPAHQRFASPTSGGQRVTGTSLKRRARTEKLADMDPEVLANYDLRLASNVGRRLQESGRAVALSDMHDRMAALGERIDGMDELAARLEDFPDAAKRMLHRTPTGFKPLTDKYGALDMDKARAAFREGGEVVEVPTAAFDHLEDLRQRGRSVQERDENVALRGYDKVQGAVKTAQTAVNPGYHGTNLVGDTYNARIAGTTVGDIKAATRLKWVEMGLDKAARDLTPRERLRVKKAAERVDTYAHGEKLTDLELVQEAVEVGAIKTGFAGHELPELTKGKDIKTRRSAMDLVRAGSENREDLIRLATYRGARKNGMTADEAADWVGKHHFEYGDLTEAERSFARRVVPFYTFMARNSRLQVASLGRRPGVPATYEKAREEMAKAADMDPEFAETLQRFEQQGVPVALPLRVGGNPTVLFPKLPITDLNNVTANPATAFENLLGRMSVLIKVPVEQGLGYNTFTRSEYTKDRVPAPSALRYPPLRAAVNSFFRQLGIEPAVKDIEDNRTGEMVPGWSWRVDQLLRQVPASNLAANVNTPSRHGKPQDPYMSLIGYVAGPRPAILDPHQVSLNQLWDEHEQLDAQINELKQTVKHKSGDEWKGRIGALGERLGKLEVQIAKTSKGMGVADPPFANRISSGKGKAKRKKAVKMFGAKTP